MKQFLDPWYVTGFCESGASFTYSRSGRSLGLYFALKVSPSELPLLQAIQRFFYGAGRLYDIKTDSEVPGPRRIRAVYYRVARRDDLERLVLHFDQYALMGPKAARYALWRDMVVLKRQFRRPDRTRLEELAARLSALSREAT